MAVLDLKIERKSELTSKKKSFKGRDTIDPTTEKKRGGRNNKPPTKENAKISHKDDDDVMEMYRDYDLYLAAKNGDLNDFKRILDRVSTAESVDVLSRLSPNGNTFLHVAATHGNQDMANFIASKEPSLVLAKNFNGDTALHLVARGGDESMVVALVKIHRDFLVQNPESNNLLMAKNERGNTAVHEALLSSLHLTAEYLIRENPELSY